jgi:hypothetical protein
MHEIYVLLFYIYIYTRCSPSGLSIVMCLLKSPLNLRLLLLTFNLLVILKATSQLEEH